MRPVFFVSDGTAITAETLGQSLLAQFDGIPFEKLRRPFIDSIDKAQHCAGEIRAAHAKSGMRPIVISTLVSREIGEIVRSSNALHLDFFGTFISPLESELGEKSTHAIGRFHGRASSSDYSARIDAINFTLAHDDGVSNTDLDKAEVILVGVSRCGKTPTSLYLALQFGLRVANYPLIPEDFERKRMPEAIGKHRSKLFGLSIAPERLAQVRRERRPDSRYASLENCRWEVDEALKLMRREGIQWLDSTTKSIEEISATLMQTIRGS